VGVVIVGNENGRALGENNALGTCESNAIPNKFIGKKWLGCGVGSDESDPDGTSDNLILDLQYDVSLNTEYDFCLNHRPVINDVSHVALSLELKQ